VDTQKPELMRETLAAGASMINDVNALLAPGALQAAAQSKAAVCLMHKQRTPADMQVDPRYADVTAEVYEFLRGRVQAALAAGIAAERIVIDPGFGFGKSLEHNLELLRRLERFDAAGAVVLAGLSRKAMLGPHHRPRRERADPCKRRGGIDRGAERRAYRARARCGGNARRAGGVECSQRIKLANAPQAFLRTERKINRP
jgi:dihydropteroate synthase